MAKIVIIPPGGRKPIEPPEPAAAPPGLPSLSRQDIVDWTGETSIKRGTPYVDDALFDTRRTGLVLKARCQGTAAHPYRVTATLGAQGGIKQSTCSCPVGGRCKHVAALLLRWLRDPDAFLEVEDLEASLERRDKAELIMLIRQMIARHPELETLLELPLPIAGKANQPVDLTRIRREIDAAFRSAGYDWDSGTEAAQALEPLLTLADDYARLDDRQSAAAIFQAIIAGVREHSDDVQDESGDLNDVIDQCTEGIGICLEASDDAAEREALLRMLFELYRWEVSSGGRGIAEEAPELILEHATSEERQVVANWVRDALPADDSWSAEWQQQAFGGFLLELAGDTIDEEVFLQICRDTGRRRDLVERLLQLGRFDEAAAEVRQAGDRELLRLVDLMREHGQGEQAEELVRRRHSAAQNQEHLTAWLRDRARERGDLGEALALTETIFWHRPGLSAYDDVKEAAQAHGTWDTLRPGLLQRLERDQRRHTLLAEIHLHDGEIEQALAMLKRGTMLSMYAGEPLPIRVARAAEESHPAEAIAIYRKAAEDRIKWQGRGNYIEAAAYLARIRDLYLRHGADSTWYSLIAKLRTENSRLRALREELDRAGL